MTESIQDLFKLVSGLCIGSFLNVAIYRIPNSISIISPRSFCPNCKKKLKIKENIPIFSWILQKGKCSNCSKKINIRYPFIEILTSILFLVFSYSSPEIYILNYGFLFENIFSWIFLSLLLVISFIDIEHFWIPQILINFGFLFGIINLTIVEFFNKSDFTNYLYEGLLASLVSFLLFEIIRLTAKKIYKRDALGKGDSKLVSMIALWLGPIGITISLGISYVIAAIFIMVLYTFKKIRKGQYIPFAPFLSVGGLVVWYFGNKSLISYFYNF